MTELLAARLQMAISLGFHIIFAAIGIAMPFFMAVSHWLWLKKGDPDYETLTRAWSKGVAIFFATGAVSGTALSFELGLLWPTFMEHAGPIFGMPFSWEGTAFFLEAIFLGLFLYGWNRLHPWVHWSCGLMVGICGVLSGVFVLCANGWMNAPTGFDWIDGQAYNIDPVAAMWNDAALDQGLHMTIAAFQATGFAVAGLHAFLFLQNPGQKLHKKALYIALGFGAIAALLQPISGDLSAKGVAKRQPLKLAAMENLENTRTQAPIKVGPIEIPGALSFLAFGDFNAEVKGLNDFPKEEHPPVGIVHLAFLVMVGIGFSLMAVGAYFLFRHFWQKRPLQRAYLWILTLCTPLGFIAIEAGWIVTEVGRQPWIIYGILKTADSLTPMPGLTISLILFTVLYLILALAVTWLLTRQIRVLSAKIATRKAID